jgi:hypothetical protein
LLTLVSLFPLFLTFLFPVVIYLMALTVLNKARHPVMVSGTWDFVGVLFAASGLLLFGGPTILDTLLENTRLAWVLDRSAPPQALSASPVWALVSLVYFTAVVVGAALLLRQRTRMTAVYNVEPAVFEAVLGQALDRLKLDAWREGNHLRLGRQGQAPEATLDLDPWPAMYHVSLRWGGRESGIRRKVEGELSAGLAEVHTSDNPAGGWFLLASCLGLLLMIVMVLFLLLTLSPRLLR